MKILLTILLFLVSYPAWATTYYVRDGGAAYGTSSTTCNGLTNAVYVTNSGPNCAVSHPAYIIGAGNDGGGTSVWSGGDTLYIDGDSDTSPGNQAQYAIGYGMPTQSSCDSGAKYNCWLDNIPAGSSGTPTQIIGTGTHKPQLYGSTQTYQILDAENNYITLQWMEITDHTACATGDPTGSCTGTGPYGTYGIITSGTGLTFTDVYVHGLGSYGIVTNAIGDATFTRVWVIGNGVGGFIVGYGGSTAVTGTLTLNQPIIEWNGCVEAYPLTGGIDNPANYTNCWGQDSGGYGDGLAFGATGSANPGNWTIIGPGSISWNTQDGLDILHGAATGNTIQIDKMRFEGNAGQQIKLNGTNEYVTNSLIFGDCGWWYESAQALSGGMGTGGDGSCRALGDTILFSTSSSSSGTDSFYNNTIMSNGTIIFLQSGTCNSSNNILIKNNIIQGGWAWIKDSNFTGGTDVQSAYYYYGGTDGDGTSCTSPTLTEDYNIVTGAKSSNAGCSGAHDKCGTSPSFTGTVPVGASGGALNTFYQAWSGITLLGIQSGSAAKSAAVGGLTYWNTSTDYYSNANASMGALEYNSTAANGYLCFFNSDCSSNMCTANVCTASGGTVNSSLTAGDKIVGTVD